MNDSFNIGDIVMYNFEEFSIWSHYVEILINYKYKYFIIENTRQHNFEFQIKLKNFNDSDVEYFDSAGFIKLPHNHPIYRSLKLHKIYKN
jgi:hypothetical protein